MKTTILSTLFALTMLVTSVQAKDFFHIIYGVSGTVHEEKNLPTNVIDFNTKTKWAAEMRDNEELPYIVLDLGEVVEVNLVWIQFPEGHRRDDYFMIQALADGVGFLDIGGGVSKQTNKLDSYPTLHLYTRYIRIYAMGNDGRSGGGKGWTSISEVKVGYSDTYQPYESYPECRH